MKARQYSNEDERLILTGMIVNSTVLGKVVSGLKDEHKPFESKWSNQIYHWCRGFHERYGRAPKGTILSLFRTYAAKQKDDNTVELIEKFLSSLSDDYRAQAKSTNVDYLVDLASTHFNKVRYARLRDTLETGLLENDVKSIQETVASFHPISFSTSTVVEILVQKEPWREAVETPEDQTLIQYPGALGEFFGPHLERDGFIAFLAPEKRGKSFFLIDVAWRAVKDKRHTFFFSVGDMSRRQMIQRLGIRAVRRPINLTTVQIPRHLERLPGGEVKVRFKPVVFEKRVSVSEWMAAQERVHLLTASSTSLLKLSCSPNSTKTVADIEADLDEAIREGWVPDVVVIDYADILAPEAGTKDQDFRHATNETWKALRRLSQEYHCLVVTATQSDAASYEQKIIRKKNFSEDKRKLSHVTGMAALNQTEEEKVKGLYRLNWIVLREGLSFETRCVTVAGSLALANPAMKSCW